MLFIFDLDDTLIHEGFDDIPGVFIFDETIEVLKFLKNSGHILAIASHNDRALELLKKNGISQYFDFNLVQGYEHTDKIGHLTNILNNCKKFTAKDCIFFDDLEVHVKIAHNMGMQGEVCCYKKGITMKQIIKYLKKY